jgi:class 3 adenylate cyclase/tetratricopeptide (TPR) repeat protein
MAEVPQLRCPSCGRPNRPDRRFCGGCGAGLAQTCGVCGAPNESDERFCGRCGNALGTAAPAGRPASAPAAYTPRHLAEKIFHHRRALEGERKQITILFADVKGSMELAAQLDVEAWRAILDRFFAILADGVHRFEGTVNQFTGDGIMALFGAPIAHEDHAQRACWAALHLAEELRRYGRTLRLEQGLDFSVRMGVNSGEVVVGRIGDDLRMDYTAQGNTVGLAARMEQIAEAGKIYVTEHTAALVQGFFRLDELGSFAVKGVHAPVRVFELAGVGPHRTRLDVSRGRGFSRFVGRAAETGALDAALARVVSGRGQVVGVMGEAGVGKSRLCHEFLERCRRAGLPVFAAHAVAHGRLIPFLPVLELLRNYFGVTEADDDRAARRKIAGTLLLLDEQLRDALPLVLDFLGVPDPEHPLPAMEPEGRQQALGTLIGRLVQAHSRREPVAIFLEDLHWIDGGSEQFLETLVEVIADTRVLLLVNFRPEYQASWMTRPHYGQVPLAPLDAAATDELLLGLLGNDPSLGALRARIRSSTVGNPFFVEEVIRTLAESGSLIGPTGGYRLAHPVETVAIPPTVQAVLAARIDRLPEREKAVLETAAVIGKEFPEALLTRVAGLPAGELAAALGALARAEFIHEESVFPVAAWAFRHPLTQEVAYRTPLAERRARLHAGVARALIELHADRLDERAALVSHHWELAGARLDAARWSRRAALWVGMSNYPEALRHWRRLRTLVDGLPASPETTELAGDARKNVLSFGVRLGAPSDEIDALFAEASADTTSDGRELAVMLAGQGMIHAMRGEVVDALEPLTQALRLAEGAQDPGLLAAVRACMVIEHGFAGNIREAVALSEQALAEAPADARAGFEFFNFSPYVYLLMSRSWLLREVGRVADAERELIQATALARELDEHEALISLEQSHVYLARTTGDARGVLDHARIAVEMAERIGNPLSRVQSYAALGVAHFLRAELHDAARATEQGIALLRETGVGMTEESYQLATLAEIQAELGDGRARATAEQAIARAQQQRTRVSEAHAWLALARVLRRTGGRAAESDVTAALDHVLAIAAAIGGVLLEALARVELVLLARLTGDATAATREAAIAERLYREMGIPGCAERVARV